MSKTSFASMVSLLLLVAVAAVAQGGARGAITGTVTDPSGAVIRDATVTIINQDTGVTERTVTSGSQGAFSATLLPIGTYRVEVTAPGFSRTVAAGIPVRVSETSVVPVQMQVGTSTVEVTVTGAATPVEVTNPTTGQALTGDVIREMPLATRNFLGLLALSAGTNSEFADTTALGRGQTTIIVNGQRPVNNNYQLEGINANDVSLPVFDNVNLPNPDVVEEFKTQTSLYDASQGRNGGGNMQVNLRSGTDQYHGDVFEYFRNNDMNANDWFLKQSEILAGTPNVAPVLRQNAFGASIGGPVPGIKNFFFFGNYSGVREDSGIATGTTIDTEIPVLPASRSAASLEKAFGVPQIDPVALAWLNLPASNCPGFNDGVHCIPSLPGTPGVVNGVTNLASLHLSSVGTFSDSQFTITTDKKFGTKDTFTVRWFFDDTTALRPYGEAATLPFSEDNPLSNRFLKIGLTHIFSPSMVNEFRFGYSRYRFDLLPTEPVSLADIDSTRPNAAEFPGAWQPNITGGGFSIGVGANDNRGTRDNTFVWGDDLSKTLGKHTLRVGGEIDYWQLNRYNHYEKRGVVTYAANPVAFPGLNGFQNFLLGNINTTAGEAGIDTFHFRATDGAAYVQDDWKITSRLTLNLGLRWEGIDTAHEENNYLTNIAGIARCGSTGCSSDGYSAPPLNYIHPPGALGGFGTPGVSDCTELTCFAYKNFAPRVGFAWDIFGDHKTALRGGYGIYYQRVSNQSQLQSAGGPPFNVAFSATPGSVTPANPFPQLLPNSAFPLPLTKCPAGVCTGYTLGATSYGIPSGFPRLSGFNATGTPLFDNTGGNFSNLPNSEFFFYPVRDFVPPYAQQFNLTVQRELARGWVVELGYIGSVGDRLLGPGRGQNAGRLCNLASPCVIPRSALSPSFTPPPAGTPDVVMNSNGSVSITGSTAPNLNARVFVPYLGLQSPYAFVQENNSHSNYNSFQATLIHQFAKGLYLQAAYTWSKSIDNASGSEVNDELNGLQQFGNLLNVDSNRGLSDFDRPQRLVISYSYLLPFGSPHGWGILAHGWTLQGTTYFQSGTPFAIYDSSALSLSDPTGFEGLNFATLVPGTPLSAVLTRGSKMDKINSFVNMNDFVPGGLCSDDQGNTLSIPVLLSGAPNPACATGLAAIGDVRRNSFRGFFQQEWDFSLHKTTNITERLNFLIGADFFNLFNHPSFASPQSGPNSPYGAYTGGSNGNYGAINLATGSSSILDTVNRPRIIQVVAKINF
ncbi:MAG TPA: TonB-dependent receptor [Terriglobales bacterium]|nr:TonB-dependent receptor [Terriglobales bacterium]